MQGVLDDYYGWYEILDIYYYISTSTWYMSQNAWYYLYSSGTMSLFYTVYMCM